MREGRTRKDGDRRRGTNLVRDLMQQLATALLDALRAKDERPPAGGRMFENDTHVLSRRHHQPGVARAQLGEVRSRPNRFAQRNIGKEKAVLMARVDCFDHFGFERPEHCFASAGRGNLRKRGAPGAATDYAEPHAFTPAPRTFSALSSSG